MRDEVREFWRQNTRDLVRESVKSIEETAKQLIGVVSILEGLYFHAITYADIRGKVSTLEKIGYMSPLFFWTLSLVAALLVYFPRAYDTNIASWRHSKRMFQNIVAWKRIWLMIAAVLMVCGGALLLVVLAFYLN